MIRRMSIGEFLGCLIDHITEHTGITCYDFPEDRPSPLFSAEIETTEDARTKTMCLDVFNVLIHCISEPVEPFSTAPVYRLVQQVEEAMESELELPKPFLLNTQDFMGLRVVTRDQSGEGHAILSYRIEVCYGLLCK